jgi:alginate O-acetyltransferase complex protein AlgJ
MPPGAGLPAAGPPAAEPPGAQDVHRGKDGWLFLVGGSNRTLNFYTSPDAFPDAIVQKWLLLLRARRERCQLLGATYAHLIVPEKLTVYHDKFDGELPYRGQSPALRLPAAARAAGLADVVVDVVPYFMQQKAHYKLFWQTDTHWTFEGCLCALQILCSHLRLEASPAIVRGQRRQAALLLDLGAKLDPPVREEFVMMSYPDGARRVAVNPLVAFKERTRRDNDIGLHVGSNVVFCNYRPEAINKTVVLFGDSFAEYRPHLLTGMLAETFREVHFVWSTSLDWGYIERVKPDLLITAAAERFAAQVPSDTFDLDHYVVTLLAPLMAASHPN